MSLGKASLDEALKAALSEWKSRSPSEVLAHHRQCCAYARHWFRAMDRSLNWSTGGIPAPSWLTERYPWGPSEWPIYWCNAIRSEKLDCGALASIARDLFSDRGYTALPFQLVQVYSEQDITHWSKKWDGNPTPAWTEGRLVYHEACAIMSGPEDIQVWDPSIGNWVSPARTLGYEATLAVCISTPSSPAGRVRWGDHIIAVNCWVRLP